MQRILVTGGAGFIGSHLVPRLLEAGHHVLTIDNLSFGKMTYLPLTSDTFEFVKSDITDKVILAKILKKFEPQIVIHLAAIHYIPYCNAHPVKTTEINIMGTRILFEFCRKIELDLLFFASTAAVYPIRDVANSENSQLGPIDIYGYTKVIGEDLAKLFYLETNIKTIIGRLFNVYGPNETNPHLIPEIIDQLKSGKREVHLGNLEPKRDYIHVEDVVTSIITLINRWKGKFDIFNIGSGKEYSVKQVVEYTQEALSVNIKIVQDKDKMRASDRMHLLADINKIQTEINWNPQWTLKNGLKELLKS